MILSLELYNAAQAVYLRADRDSNLELGEGTKALYGRVHHLIVIAPILDDRPYNAEVNLVKEII